MKLIASVPVFNEYGRFLRPFIGHLLVFCDEVRVLDDHSTDGSFDFLMGDGADFDVSRVHVMRAPGPRFFEHEGQFRNRLLQWTLEGEPTHILSVDADEFVAEGSIVRDCCANPQGIWTLEMEEVWKAREVLWIRVDGGWRRRQVPILYTVPAQRGRNFQIANRALACGREPQEIALRAIRGGAQPSGTSLLHMGWSRESERQERYQRYATHDGGKFHASSHLASILWADEKITLETRDWPADLPAEMLLEIANR